MSKKGKITVSEAGRKGGKTTSKKHGPEFYSLIGKKGGVKKKGSQSKQKKVERGATEKGKMTVGEAGHKGGTTTSKRYGPEFYEQIGHKGGQKVKRLIEAGKKALE